MNLRLRRQKHLNRTHRDIKALILDYALRHKEHHKELTVSKMFYKGEMSWTMVCTYRKALVSMGFLHSIQKGVKTVFFITVKGREWLSHYKRMKELEQL